MNFKISYTDYIDDNLLYNRVNMTFRYDPNGNSYHRDMEGSGVICSAVDILPTEFAREVKILHLSSFYSVSFAESFLIITLYRF